MNTTAWPLKEPSSTHCRDRQRETRRPHWLALKRSRAIPDCRRSQRGLGRSQRSLALVPTACCGYQLMGRTQQCWAHRLPGLGTPVARAGHARLIRERHGRSWCRGALRQARSSTQLSLLPWERRTPHFQKLQRWERQCSPHRPSGGLEASFGSARR